MRPVHDPLLFEKTSFTNESGFKAQHIGKLFTNFPENQHPEQVFAGASFTVKSVDVLPLNFIAKIMWHLIPLALVLPVAHQHWLLLLLSLTKYQ